MKKRVKDTPLAPDAEIFDTVPAMRRKAGPIPRVQTLAALWLLAFAATAGAQDAAVPLSSIDVYGSDAIDPAAFREEFGSDIARLVAMMEKARLDPDAAPAELDGLASDLQQRVATKLNSIVPLADLDFSATTDFGPPPRIHVMVSVVEEADRARRMPFRAAPSGRFADPDGLLALWAEHMQKAFALAYAGRSITVRDCPVLHCIAPFGLPELAPYLERFNAGARKHEDELYRIAAQSADAQQRADALFLLAHTNDARRLLPVLGSAIYDADGGVRNNAMRVLLHLAQHRPELDFPVADLIAALDFPASSDRNKAGYTLAALAAQPRYRGEIGRGAVPTALRMLRLEQPNNHDPAYEILKLVSGETFGARDYAAWERWAAANVRQL